MFPQMTDDTKTWWSEQIRSLGFPIVVCIALMWGGYNIFTVFITPTFQKQMETLERVNSTQESIVEKLSTITTDVALVKETQAQFNASQKDVLSTLKEIEKNTANK